MYSTCMHAVNLSWLNYDVVLPLKFLPQIQLGKVITYHHKYFYPNRLTSWLYYGIFLLARKNRDSRSWPAWPVTRVASLPGITQRGHTDRTRPRSDFPLHNPHPPNGWHIIIYSISSTESLELWSALKREYLYLISNIHVPSYSGWLSCGCCKVYSAVWTW